MTSGDLIAGRYQIEEELGRGASSTVYRARDTVLDRTVALKVLSSMFASDSSFMRRFQQEARLAARLDHRNIVTIYDVGTLPDGRAYISMQLLTGTSLAEIIAQRAPLPAEEVVTIVEQLADALDYTHDAGLVHRDVKPSNVIVSPTGRATLSDFGIARALEESRLTLPGLAIGTPRYMSPEQVRGEDVSAATDIYALGVIAFELLAGRPPFESEGTGLMYKIVHEEPPPLTVFNGQVPEAVVPVLNRALAKRAADRWGSAGEFARALRTALLQGRTATLSPPVSAPAGSPSDDAATRIGPLPPESPVVAAAAPDDSTATRLGPAVPPADEASTRTPSGRPEAEPERAAPPDRSPTRTSATSPPFEAATQVASTSPEPEARPFLPDVTAPRTERDEEPAAAPPDAIGPTVVGRIDPVPPPVQLRAERPTEVVTGGPLPTRKGFRLSPISWIIAAGGAVLLVLLLAFVFLQGRGGENAQPGGQGEAGGRRPGVGGPTVRILSPADGSGVVAPVTVSIDAPGVLIDAAAKNTPGAHHFHVLVDVDPGSLPPGAPIPTGQEGRGIFHTAERTFRIDMPLSVGEHTIWVVLTENDHIPLRPNVVAKTTFRILRSLEDARTWEQAPVVFYSNVGTPGRWHIFAIERPSGQVRQLTSGNSDNVRPSFSPDGDQIVFRSNREGGRWLLYMMNANGTNQRPLTRPDGTPIEGDDPVWSPDGTRIVFHAFRDGGEQLHVYNVTTGEVQQLTNLANNHISPSWSPDGSKIAFQSDQAGGQQIFIINADGRNRTQLTTGPTNNHFPAWSPDGRSIAFSSFEGGTYKIYTIGTDGQNRRKITDGGGDSGDQNPWWAPNGKHLLFQSTRASSEQRLYVVEVESGQVRELTSGRPQDLAPRFPLR